MLLSHANYLLLSTAAAIGFLMLLILRAKLHPALAILLAAIALGCISGMPPASIPASIATGAGNLLGHVALVLGLGAVLGNLLARSGGAAAVGEGLVATANRIGAWALPVAMVLMGMLVGFPVFFEVGLVLLMPIIVSVARQSGKSAMAAGVPTLAGLSIVHGLIPPHPAAMLAVAQYHADVGRTILLGVAAGLPAAMFTGLGCSWLFGRQDARRKAPPAALDVPHSPSLVDELASGTPFHPQHKGRLIAASLAVLLLPVLLIFLGSWANSLLDPHGNLAQWNAVLHLLGDPSVALLLAVLAALLLLGKASGWTPKETLRLSGESFAPIAGILMILAAAGGLSRVLSDSGAAQAVIELAQGVHLSPLLLAWMLAATVRIAVGSATVAMAVTSGILAPLAATMGVGFGPELMVLATGAGSLGFSHVNDPGFWMAKEFFGLEVSQTLKTWTLMESMLSITGLLGTLLLAAILRVS